MELLSRAAVFLDRDGTLIEDTGYLSDPASVRILAGAVEALRLLQALGLPLVVVSNQSGLGRGLISAHQAATVHARFVELFERAGIVFDLVLYCPHHPDAGCDCRKPSPGLLLQAEDELALDLSRSFMIGDKLSDADSGRRAGVSSILLTGNPERAAQALEEGFVVCPDILAAAKLVQKLVTPASR